MSNITFVINDKYYLANKTLHPKPLKEFIPKWYKNMNPSSMKNKSYTEQINVVLNVKSCPSFTDIYKEGFVIVAPHDYIITYDEKTGNWSWKTPIVYKSFDVPNNREQVEIHSNNQMKGYLSNNSIKAIFKIVLPLKVITPKGYSVRQAPVPYSSNKDFETMYGILRSDKVHEVNIQIGYKSKNKEILIKKGEPLCVYYPFKRENYKLNIVSIENKIMQKIYVNTSNLYSSFNKKFKNIKNL